MQDLHNSECGALEVSVWKFKIKNMTAGRGIFADRTLVSKEVMGYYCGSVVYETMMGYPIKTKVYGEGVIEVAVSDVLK